MHMRIIILSLIALLINFAASGQGKPPIGGTATDTAWIRGSLQVDKKLQFKGYPSAVITTDTNGKVAPLSILEVLNSKTIDTPYRYSVSGNHMFLHKPYSVGVQGITYINDSNAILVYREDTANGHVSNSAVLYYQRLVNYEWQAPALLYNSSSDDRYGQFYKTITGDTLISQIRRLNASTFQEIDVVNAYTTDGGATISTYQAITSTPYGYIPYGIVPAEGKYYQLWVRGDTVRLYRSDNGLTAWTLISTVSQTQGAVEPSLVYTGNNTFIVLARSLTIGSPNLKQFVSTNLGSSFSFLGYAPFGNVQPSMYYDTKRKLIVAIATQRKNATVEGEFEGYTNVWVAKPTEILTDTSKWINIANLQRPVPNVKAFPGAGIINYKNDSTLIVYITDAFQCDTGVIGDLCDKTSPYEMTITYSDKNLSNIGGIEGFVWVDSQGNQSIRNYPHAVTLTDDSSTTFLHDKPLVFQQNPFNQDEKAWYIIGVDNTINTLVYKDGRTFFNSEATFGSDVNIGGDINGEGSINTAQPPHIASNPDVLFGGVRDTAGTKQWGIRIGTTNYWGLLSTDGNFGFLSGSGSNSNTYLAMFDADGKLTNSGFRSQTGFNQSLQPLIISGSASASQFGAQIYSLNNANGERRWDFAVLNSEVGSNVGSNYTLRAYDDNNNYLFPVLTAIRANANIYFYNAISTDKPNAAAAAGLFKIGQVVLGTNGIDKYLEVEIDGQMGYLPFFDTKP